MIRFENLHIGYSSGLLRVNFTELKAGMCYALVGENGSGKSTFLKTISGQLVPFSGGFTMNSKDSQSMDKREFSELVAFIPSQIAQISNLTVHDFVGLGRTPYLSALGRLSQKDIQIIQAALEELKISHLKHKMLSELSDGERQLSAIASAICQQTPLVLLDEPTSHLDYRNRLMVLEILRNLAKSHDKCIVFSTHDLEIVAENLDAVICASRVKSELLLLEGKITKEVLISEAFGD